MGWAERISSYLRFIHFDDDGVGEGGRGRKEFKWKDAIINSLILALLNFFTTLAGITASGILSDPVRSLLAGVIAGGVAFFSRLAFERGIYRGENRTR